LDWQVQREILLKIAGGITLEEIAANRSDFSALLLQLSGKSLAEFKSEISARKKKIKDALDLIPARIDEVTRATPAAPDYKALEAEKTAVENNIGTIEMAMESAAGLARVEYEAQAEIQRQINTQKGIQQQAVFDAKQKSKEEWNNRNAATNEAKTKLTSIQQRAERTAEMRRKEMTALEGDLKKGQYQLSEINKKIELKRTSWFSQNKLEYDPKNSICPTCGQEYLVKQIEAKEKDFEKRKAELLEQIMPT